MAGKISQYLPAPSTPVTVLGAGTTAPATLYSDPAASVPLANPATTDAAGLLQAFTATAGTALTLTFSLNGSTHSMEILS